MKKIVLFCLAGIISASQAFAQPCAITNVSVGIKNIAITGANSSGTVTLDLSFTANFNSGNKHAVIHLYRDDNYPTGQTYVDASGAFTSQAVGTLVIADAGDQQISKVIYAPSYPAALGTLTTPYITQGPGDFSANGPNSARNFSFKNVTLQLSGLDQLVKIVADVYATQNNNNTTGGCLNLGAFSFYANEPGLRGLMVCGTARAINFSLYTLTTKQVTIKAYRDVAPFTVFDAADEAAQLNITLGSLSGSSITVDNTGSLNPSNFVNYGPLTYTPQTTSGVWIEAVAANNTNVSRILVENTCGTLPVQFKSFTATRRNQQVVLKWETAMELNNRGFQVQRNINGNWENIGFVATAAQDGNSTSLLSYNFTDNNNHQGVSQYRIMQIDIDGAVKYSEIRAVRGEEQIQKIMVYPNPSATGQVNLLFDGTASTRNIIVRDITGREIQNHRNVTANNFTISNLSTGMYQIQIIDLSTAAVSTEKVIITKR